MQDLDHKKTWPVFITFAVIVLGVVGYYSWKYYEDTKVVNPNFSKPIKEISLLDGFSKPIFLKNSKLTSEPLQEYWKQSDGYWIPLKDDTEEINIKLIVGQDDKVLENLQGKIRTILKNNGYVLNVSNTIDDINRESFDSGNNKCVVYWHFHYDPLANTVYPNEKNYLINIHCGTIASETDKYTGIITTFIDNKKSLVPIASDNYTELLHTVNIDKSDELLTLDNSVIQNNIRYVKGRFFKVLPNYWGFGGSGLWIAKQEKGKWIFIASNKTGKWACDVIDKYKVPQEIYGDCSLPISHASTAPTNFVASKFKPIDEISSLEGFRKIVPIKNTEINVGMQQEYWKQSDGYWIPLKDDTLETYTVLTVGTDDQKFKDLQNEIRTIFTNNEYKLNSINTISNQNRESYESENNKCVIYWIYYPTMNSSSYENHYNLVIHCGTIASGADKYTGIISNSIDGVSSIAPTDSDNYQDLLNAVNPEKTDELITIDKSVMQNNIRFVKGRFFVVFPATQGSSGSGRWIAKQENSKWILIATNRTGDWNYEVSDISQIPGEIY